MTFSQAHQQAIQLAQGQTWRGEVERMLCRPVSLYTSVFGNLIVTSRAFWRRFPG